MVPTLLGRTNESFPSIWLELIPPSGTNTTDWQSLAKEAEASGLPLDISRQPGLWGGCLRSTSSTLMTRSSLDHENAIDSDHAVRLVQAHLIETLSCIGRETLDFYFLRIRKRLEEFQINGVLEALEMARQEGHIRFLGLASEGNAMATQLTWQFNDAFDVLLLPHEPERSPEIKLLVDTAERRRVGVVWSTAQWLPGLTSLIPVRQATDLQLLQEA